MALGGIGPIGFNELAIIALVALLLFGGRLPDVARSLGRSVNQFKKGLKDVEDGVNHDDDESPAPKSLPSSAASLETPTKVEEKSAH